MAFKLSELFGRKKKYPFNKKNPPAAVYAGPEYFARRAPRNGENGRIYAGPERFGRRDADVEIYAGPEYYERQAPEGPEEDAPLPPEEETYTAVYAGPEPPEDAEAAAPADKPGLLVYAGPEFFARRAAKAPDEALAAGVYAGPQPGPMMGMMGMAKAAETPSPAEKEKADGEA